MTFPGPHRIIEEPGPDEDPIFVPDEEPEREPERKPEPEREPKVPA